MTAIQLEKVHFLPPQHDATADLAILIVSWNVKDLVLKNIEALLESRGSMTAEIILIDNDSKDGTVEAIQAQFPQVRVIVNKTNLGFAWANEQGRKVARARHSLLLNPDMRVEPTALQKTVEYLDTHPSVAVLGAHLVSMDAKTIHSVRRLPSVWSQMCILLKLPHFFPGCLRHYLWSDFDYTQEQAVEVVRGSYFAIQGKALTVLGGLDTRYFLWFEEVDYCKQVLNHGWQVMYVPSIQATDYVGRSFSQTRRFLAQKRFVRSLIQYFKKWHPTWQVRLLQTVGIIGLSLAWVMDRWMALFKTKDYHRAQT